MIDWTPAKIAELRALWADPSLSSTDGAALMGMTKNAFIGKAHRLLLGTKAGSETRRFPPTRPPVAAPLAPVAQGRACLWPLWPDATGVPAPALFCGAARYDGARTPYCREHYRKSVSAPWRGRVAAVLLLLALAPMPAHDPILSPPSLPTDRPAIETPPVTVPAP